MDFRLAEIGGGGCGGGGGSAQKQEGCLIFFCGAIWAPAVRQIRTAAAAATTTAQLPGVNTASPWSFTVIYLLLLSFLR